MDWHWNEATLEWIDKPGVKPYASWTYNEENQEWEAPITRPISDKPGGYYTWNEETLTWEEQ
jgi:hypothetical protein